MGQFEKIVDKFRGAQEDIRKIGNSVVENYPNSTKLIEMAKEIEVAVTALDELARGLEEALQEADADQSLYKQLMEQMKDSDIYSELKPEEQRQLAEWLTQAKRPLADEEMLQEYVIRTLSQKPSSDLVAMYPKRKVIERGQQMDDGSDAFDAYTAGMKAYQADFDNDKAKAVKALAEVWMQRGLPAIAKEFYAKAMKPGDETDIEREKANEKSTD